jgi:hypothetical protein
MPSANPYALTTQGYYGVGFGQQSDATYASLRAEQKNQ